MRRTLHPSPRHLDDPLRLGPFTVQQWALLALCALATWACLEYLPAWVPGSARLSVASTLIGLPLGLVWAGGGARSLFELPLRAARYALAAREYVPGETGEGPLTLELLERRPSQEDTHDD